MPIVLAAIIVHVVLGVAWAFATVVVAITGWGRAPWLRLILVLALVNMLAGIYLWHALHRGTWGPSEHLLVVGTFCAFVALGLQAPVAFTTPRGARRLESPALWIYRATAVLVLAAATAMIASKL